MTNLDTDAISEKYRAEAVRTETRELLIARLEGSAQEPDLTAPTNCEGMGRVRHFRRGGSHGWVPNPLPLDPAAHALGLETTDEIRAQVFQNAICNWRCWYCYVPFSLLGAHPRHSTWLSVDRLVDLYADLDDRPDVLDLSGGQPDLVPEWIPWTMDALRRRRLDDRVYLWSDDNLSNDYFWRYLDKKQRTEIADYPMYGRVCCFKGIDAEAFSFNTAASPRLFEVQFDLFGRLLALGMDLYAYVTLTTPDSAGLVPKIDLFIDRLQGVHENLPLRTVPLEIQSFSPVEPRLNDSRCMALEHQHLAIDLWTDALSRRFSTRELEAPIHQVPVGHRR